MYREEQPAPFLITAFNGHVVAVEAQTGRVAWTVPMPVLRCAVENDVVVVASPESVAGPSYRTGERLWVTPTKYDPSYDVTLLLERGAIFLSFTGQLLALDYQGRELWRNPLPGTGYGTPSLAVPGAVAHGDYSRR